MHDNGSGTAVRDYNWQSDAANGIPVSAPEMDAETDGTATCLTNRLCKDGQNAATADISFGSHNIKSLAAGVLSTDAANVAQVQTAVAGRNWLTNPSFRLWQRYAYTGSTAVTGTVAGLYCADRWFARRDGIVAGYSLTQVAKDVVTPAGTNFPSNNAIKIQRTAADTSVTDITIAQSLDVEDARNLQATANGTRALNFSCYVLKGANFSSTSGVEISIYKNSTARRNAITGAGWTLVSSSVYLPAALSTSSFTRLNLLTATPVTTDVGISVRIRIIAPVGTAGADDSITVACCKLECIESSLMAASFTGSPYVDDPFAVQLLECQRFYFKTFVESLAPAQATLTTAGALQYRVQVAGTTAGWLGLLILPVNLQQTNAATITTFSPIQASATWYNGSTAATSGAATASMTGDRMVSIINPQVAGDTVSSSVSIHATVENDF